MLLTHADLKVADARMPDGFSLADGYALFIRGALGFLVLGAGLGLMIPDDSALDAITGPATVAPILLYAAWYLRARGLSFTAAFGLSPGRDRLVTIAWVALGLVGLQLAGESLIGAALDALRLSSHWADGLQENLIWGSWGLVARETIGSVIWAPLGEEVAFRGVLYPALRSRFGVAPAAALSAAVFAVAHGYGVARLRRGLLERRPLGAGLRADGKPLALASSRTPPATWRRRSASSPSSASQRRSTF